MLLNIRTRNHKNNVQLLYDLITWMRFILSSLKFKNSYGYPLLLVPFSVV